MNRILLLTLITTLATSSLMFVSSVIAQPNATYELVKSAIGPGGDTSASIYNLSSSIGQSDASTLSGGGYTLAGGFWAGGSNGYRVYLPLIVK
jgi:hypothetical protein